MPTLMTYEIEFSVAINMEDYGYQTNSTHAAAVIGKSTALLFDGAGGSANAGADGYAGADADCLASPLSLTLAHPPAYNTNTTPHAVKSLVSDLQIAVSDGTFLGILRAAGTKYSLDLSGVEMDVARSLDGIETLRHDIELRKFYYTEEPTPVPSPVPTTPQTR